MKLDLTDELVASVEQFTGESGKLSGRDDLPSDAEYSDAVDQLLAGAPESGEVWVFAYGSLIWNPDFDYCEDRLGTLNGWQRSFCIGWIRLYRGTPERPGIMLALDQGGSCRGVVFKLSKKKMRENLERVVRREHPVRWEKLHMEWADVSTSEGRVRALVVVTDRAHPAYLPELSEEVIVESLATAAGERGTMAEYLQSTVVHLEERGVHDPFLWRMQKLVARRIQEKRERAT